LAGKYWFSKAAKDNHKCSDGKHIRTVSTVASGRPENFAKSLQYIRMEAYTLKLHTDIPLMVGEKSVPNRYNASIFLHLALRPYFSYDSRDRFSTTMP